MQNSLSFLQLLSEHDPLPAYIIFCRKGSEIEALCQSLNLHYYSIQSGNISRLLFEFYGGQRLVRKFGVKVCFTMFGGAPIICYGVYKVSGFAYSNIIQSEIDFWAFLPWSKRVLKKAIDFLRRWQALRSDELIVETEYLYERARTGVFKNKNVSLIRMAPSQLVIDGVNDDQAGLHKSNGLFSILYLAGPQPNKRVHLLAHVFSELKRRGYSYRLLITMPESAYLRKVEEEFASVGASECLENLGFIRAATVGGLLKSVDAVINVANLESFSNNWVEAWAARKPLICTDADWARYSCGEAAVYVDPTNCSQAADRVHALMSDKEAVEKLIGSGLLQLQTLPSPEKRFLAYIRLINLALERGK